MAKKKVYAIKEVVDKATKEVIVQNKIYYNWDEVKKLVSGNKAEYKSFPTVEQAEGYLASSDPLLYKVDELYNAKALHCYVDGSFNRSIPNYSFGLVCVKDKSPLHLDFGAGTNQQAIDMQQIGGELLGAMKALLYAKKNGYKEVVIFHDYKGVCYHATGYWKRDNAFSETYYQWMQSFFQKNPEIKVHFCKVDAHTGDDFNEIADGLAKKGVDLEPHKVYFNMMEKYGLTA